MWLYESKQHRMVERQKRRLYLAYLVKDYLGLRKFLSLNDQLSAKAHAFAAADTATFEEFFQEAMPPHLTKALRREIEAWADLRVGIEHLQKSDLTIDEFKTKIGKLRDKMTPLFAVLMIEQDIMSSPLVRTFEQRIAEVEHL